MQDLAVKVLQRGLPAHDDPVPWLITVCKNLWIDTLRSANARQRAADGLIVEEALTMSAPTTIENIELHRVLETLQYLPETQRLALTLVAIEGMSYSTAAKLLGVPIGTVMSRVFRARTYLVEHFAYDQEAKI